MDIIIYSSDPDAIDPDEIQALIEAAGYFVLTVDVVDRGVR